MALFDFLPATRGDVKRLEQRMNEQQQKIDKLVADLGAVRGILADTQTNVADIAAGVNGLETSVVTLTKEVADLKAANPALDLSALETAAAGVATDVATLKSSTESAEADLADGPEETPVPTPEGGNPNI